MGSSASSLVVLNLSRTQNCRVYVVDTSRRSGLSAARPRHRAHATRARSSSVCSAPETRMPASRDSSRPRLSSQRLASSTSVVELIDAAAAPRTGLRKSASSRPLHRICDRLGSHRRCAPRSLHRRERPRDGALRARLPDAGRGHPGAHRACGDRLLGAGERDRVYDPSGWRSVWILAEASDLSRTGSIVRTGPSSHQSLVIT